MTGMKRPEKAPMPCRCCEQAAILRTLYGIWFGSLNGPFSRAKVGGFLIIAADSDGFGASA